jgi:FKBP-type peptidyl-prolyl cis-trans isomerase (trigger factor)
MFEKKLFKIKNVDIKTPCEATVEVEITHAAIEQSKAKALIRLNEQVKIDGFRPGHVPEKVLIEKIGEYAVTEEACRTFIDESFGDIIMESKQIPVNQPTIAITKLAVGEDAELKITFATPPVIELGEYKKIAKKHNKEKADVVAVEATDEEIDAMLMDLRNQVAHTDYHAKHEHGHDNHEHGEIEPATLDDAFAAKVGPFKTVDELKAAVTENVKQTKEQKNLEQFRILLIDEIIGDSKISYPSFFLTSEQNIMIEELKNDLSKNGIPYDEYLQHIGKNEEVLKEERKDIAEKRVKTQLVLSKISVTEELKPAENLVEEQMNQIMKMHPQAEKENVRAFVERFEMNQLVWKWLEEVK